MNSRPSPLADPAAPDRLNRLLDWNARSVARCAGRIVVLALLAGALIAAYTARHLGVNTDTSGMIATSPETQRDAARMKEVFPQYEDTLVIVVTARAPEAARSAAKELEVRLKGETRVFRSVYAPASGEFFEKNGLLFLSPDQLHDLTDHVAKAQPFISKLTQDPSLRGLFSLLSLALQEGGEGESLDLSPALTRFEKVIASELAGRRAPLSWQEMMRGDGGLVDERYQFILVQPRLESGDLLPVEPALKTIRRLARHLPVDPENEVRVRITGEAALGYEEIQSVFHSAGLVSTLSLLLVCFILLAGLRSVRLLLATFLTLGLGLAVTAGFAAATIGHLNMISVAFGVYYIGLGVTPSIHLGLRYRELMLQRRPASEALRESILDTAPSLILCTLTTAIGFFAFIGTSYAGVSELGLISGAGMFVSLVLSLTVLPALLTLFPLPTASRPGPTWAERLGQRLRSLPEGKSGLICFAALALGAASLFLLPKVRFDYNPLNLRDPKSESVSTLKEIETMNGGASQWGVAALAGGEAEAAEKASRLARLASVDSVMTLRSFIPEGQTEKLSLIGDISLMLGPETLDADPVAAPSPGEQVGAIRDFAARLDGYLARGGATDRAAWLPMRDAIGRLLKALSNGPEEKKARLAADIQRDLLEFLPISLKGLATALHADYVQAKDLPRDLAERWVSPSHDFRIEVSPKGELNNARALRRFVDDVKSVVPNAVGSAVQILASGEAVIRAFQQATLRALLAILVLLVVVFRNVRDALLVMLPLLLAGVLTGAASVILNVPFNFANVIALPLLLGVGVDNGIHIVQRRRSEVGGEAAAERSSVSAGVFYSSLTTLAAFTNLAFASHPGMSSLGKIHTISVSLGIVCVLIVLPALLHQLRRRPVLART